jgi:hypothetical protein
LEGRSDSRGIHLPISAIAFCHTQCDGSCKLSVFVLCIYRGTQKRGLLTDAINIHVDWPVLLLRLLCQGVSLQPSKHIRA